MTDADPADLFDLAVEKTRLTHRQADFAELRVRETTGEVIDRDELLLKWANSIMSSRSRMLSLPSRLAGTCTMREPPDIEAEATRIVQEAIDELDSMGDTE